MATASKSNVAALCARKKLFHATSGMSLEEQKQLALSMQQDSSQTLSKLQHMKKQLHKQKHTSQQNALKFAWLQEQKQLRKLEESCAREIESLLLRLLNDANADTPVSTKSKVPEPAANESDQNHEQQTTEPSSNQQSAPQEEPTEHSSCSLVFASEVDELVTLQQNLLTALMQQVLSHREQRVAMKEVLQAIRKQQETNSRGQQVEHNKNQLEQLFFETIIGYQLVETSLEHEAVECERDYQQIYDRMVLSLRSTGTKTATAYGNRTADDGIDAVVQRLDDEVFNGAECCDQLLRLETLQQAEQLCACLDEDLAQLHEQFLQQALACTDSMEQAMSKSGGWSDQDEERFLKVWKTTETSKTPTNATNELLYNQLQSILPHRQLGDLKRHLRFHQNQFFFCQKQKNRRLRFDRELQELTNEAKDKLAAAKQALSQRQSQSQSLLQLQQTQQRLHDKLKDWKLSKSATERVLSQQKEIESILQRQQQQQEHEKFSKKLLLQRQLVTDFKNARLMEELGRETQQQVEMEQREQELKRLSVVNAERVEFRKEQIQEKCQDQKKNQMRKSRLQELREARLQAIKQETPYAETIAGIEVDPERTRQETEAFRANVQAAQEEYPVHETGLFPSHGYDCDTLFRNARFKLGLALRDAGLHKSTFAVQALATINARNAGAYRNHVAQPTQLW